MNNTSDDSNIARRLRSNKKLNNFLAIMVYFCIGVFVAAQTDPIAKFLMPTDSTAVLSHLYETTLSEDDKIGLLLGHYQQVNLLLIAAGAALFTIITTNLIFGSHGRLNKLAIVFGIVSLISALRSVIDSFDSLFFLGYLVGNNVAVSHWRDSNYGLYLNTSFIALGISAVFMLLFFGAELWTKMTAQK